MTSYIVLLHDTILYIVECHVVTVKEFLSLAGKFVPIYHASSDTNGPIFMSCKMPDFFEKSLLSVAGKHPDLRVTSCHQNVSTDVDFAHIESE